MQIKQNISECKRIFLDFKTGSKLLYIVLDIIISTHLEYYNDNAMNCEDVLPNQIQD